MDRLTGKNDLGEITSYNPATDYVAGDKEIRGRLADYEDTGLSPEEVKLLQAENAELQFTKDTYLYLIEALKEMPGVLPQVLDKVSSDEFKARFTGSSDTYN